jgi:hypothetical protein
MKSNEGVNPNQDVGNSNVEVSSGGTVSFEDILSLEEGSSSSSESKESAPPKEKKAAAADTDSKTETERENDEKVASDKDVDTTPGAGKPALKLLKAKNGMATRPSKSPRTFCLKFRLMDRRNLFPPKTF